MAGLSVLSGFAVMWFRSGPLERVPPNTALFVSSYGAPKKEVSRPTQDPCGVFRRLPLRPGSQQQGVVQTIVAPEHLRPHEEGRGTEDTFLPRQLGLLPQPQLHWLRLRLGQQLRRG